MYDFMYDDRHPRHDTRRGRTAPARFGKHSDPALQYPPPRCFELNPASSQHTGIGCRRTTSLRRPGVSRQCDDLTAPKLPRPQQGTVRHPGAASSTKPRTYFFPARASTSPRTAAGQHCLPAQIATRSYSPPTSYACWTVDSCQSVTVGPLRVSRGGALAMGQDLTKQSECRAVPLSPR